MRCGERGMSMRVPRSVPGSGPLNSGRYAAYPAEGTRMITPCPILANAITADMGFLPGLALVGPAFGLPLSVLAAMLERPFYARAGVARWAIWYSLQANFASLLAGCLLLPAAMIALSAVGPLWMPVSVFLSIVIERKYLKWRAGGFDGGWKWVGWANVFSALALVGVLLLTTPFATDQTKLALFPYQKNLTYFGIAASLAAFAASFIVPAMGRRRERAISAGSSIAETAPPVKVEPSARPRGA